MSEPQTKPPEPGSSFMSPAEHGRYWHDLAQERIADNVRLTDLLKAAVHALRSYQYGNSAPELAKQVADKIDEELHDLGEAIAARSGGTYQRAKI